MPLLRQILHVPTPRGIYLLLSDIFPWEFRDETVQRSRTLVLLFELLFRSVLDYLIILRIIRIMIQLNNNMQQVPIWFLFIFPSGWHLITHWDENYVWQNRQKIKASSGFSLLDVPINSHSSSLAVASLLCQDQNRFRAKMATRLSLSRVPIFPVKYV